MSLYTNFIANICCHFRQEVGGAKFRTHSSQLDNLVTLQTNPFNKYLCMHTRAVPRSCALPEGHSARNIFDLCVHA